MKKRILLINYEFPPLGGGGGVAAKKLAEGFISNGYEVDYVTSWFKGLKKEECVEGINVHRVYVPGRHSLPTASFISLILFPFFAYNTVMKLCRKYKSSYSFINTHFAIPSGPIGVLVSKMFKIPQILSVHGGDIYDPTKSLSPHKSIVFRSIVRWVLLNSQHIVAQSSNTKDNVLKYYGSFDVKVIPLAYDFFKFTQKSRSSLNLNSKSKYLVSVGRLVKRKGFDTFLEVLSKLPPRYKAILIGDGPERLFLDAKASELKLQDRVLFVGACSELKKYQYLAVSDVYVLTSIHEGFGIVIQEAMQVGLPIVSFSNGGQIDLIKNGENGFLVTTVTEMIRAIRKIEDMVLSDRISRNNIIKSKKYSKTQIARAYCKLIKRNH